MSRRQGNLRHGVQFPLVVISGTIAHTILGFVGVKQMADKEEDYLDHIVDKVFDSVSDVLNGASEVVNDVSEPVENVVENIETAVEPLVEKTETFISSQHKTQLYLSSKTVVKNVAEALFEIALFYLIIELIYAILRLFHWLRKPKEEAKEESKEESN